MQFPGIIRGQQRSQLTKRRDERILALHLYEPSYSKNYRLLGPSTRRGINRGINDYRVRPPKVAFNIALDKLGVANKAIVGRDGVPLDRVPDRPSRVPR